MIVLVFSVVDCIHFATNCSLQIQKKTSYRKQLRKGQKWTHITK